jgi:hypothetical protein
MRLLLLFTLACTFAFCSANFHISQVLKGTRTEKFKACPSNYWNCNCYIGDRRAGKVTKKASGDSFSIDGMCGVGRMDFYKDPGANTYRMYLNGGNGEIIGRCYPNKASKICRDGWAPPLLASVSDRYVCYTYVCEP